MKIANYEMQQSAQSAFKRSEKRTLEITLERAPEPQPQRQLPPVITEPISTDTARTDATEDVEAFFHLSEEDLAKIRLLEKLLSALTGKEFKFSQAFKAYAKKTDAPQGMPFQSQAGPVAMPFGLRIQHTHEISESEAMHFSSRGVVQTEDGRTIDFQMHFHVARSYYEKSEFILQIGQALQDPLVINLDGKGIAFEGGHIELDITLDGNKDVFRTLAKGSGFLALDRNDNGTIDDGTELFGPTTGSGFYELAQHDSDGNGWIDENDAVFDNLKIWLVHSGGEKQLIGLKEAGVGAIYLGHVMSPYHIKEGDDLIAKIRSSGTYLKENGLAGLVHEIDLKI